MGMTELTHCEDELCIYYHEKKCTLGSTWLDENGDCGECIHVCFSEASLKRKRRQTRKELDEQWAAILARDGEIE